MGGKARSARKAIASAQNARKARAAQREKDGCLFGGNTRVVGITAASASKAKWRSLAKDNPTQIGPGPIGMAQLMLHSKPILTRGMRRSETS